ncbi:MBL fold metallo-hydrolase [Archangium minus]|uniref:MBL fold metallo-hydrolase n=1 Tax=Archangium minus TaxID=83450 RepID=A0ABY9X9J9_9BACT|nr:MBL fold metallo-hydrolase [Archangium minus]
MRLLLVAPLVVLLGCTRLHQPTLYSNSAQEQGDARVGQCISSDWSFETSSFWLEGPEGLILIDTQFLPSALRKEVAYAERVTGKEVKLAIVLHPNPDRFNGTGWLEQRGVRVVTSEQVRERIPDVHYKWSPVFFDKYSNGGYPRTLALPESFGSSTTELSAGGLTVKAHVLGSGCSPAHVVIEWEGHLFVGDLVANGTHSWFENGHVDEWLHRLEELRALKPRWIHPGRGRTGGPELLEEQTQYLRTVREAVKAERDSGLPEREALARVTDKVRGSYPEHRYPVFLPMLLSAEWARQDSGSTP